MSILGFLTGWFVASLGLVLGVVCLIWAVNRLYRSDTLFAAVAGVGMVMFGLLFLHAATNVVVGPNDRAVVVESTTGQVIGDVRTPGLTGVPLFGPQVITFPGAQNLEVCNDFTPSVKGGYGVKLTTCFYFNAGSVDWVTQFKRYNRYSFDALKAAWFNQLSPLVAEVVKNVTPQQLTAERGSVAELMLSTMQPWFKKEGILVNSMSLPNWDFSNADVARVFDQTIVAQTAQAQEQAKFDAAQITRKTELYVVETQQLVAAEQWKALNALGITTEAGRLEWVKLQWLVGAKPLMLIVDTTAGVPAVP